MAQLVDETKTSTCENCAGSGIDPADATPEVLQAGDPAFEEATSRGGPEVVVRPPEGCPVCAGRGEVPTVILETDDLEKLVRESHKHRDKQTSIVGADSTELPAIEAPALKDAPPTIEDRIAALEKALKAKG